MARRKQISFKTRSGRGVTFLIRPSPKKSCNECGSIVPLNKIYIAEQNIYLCDECTWQFEEELLKKVPHPKISFQEKP